MLPVGYILKDKYRILGHIASGGFGNTYLAVTLSNNVKVAVKEFFMKSINEYDTDYNVIVAIKNNEDIFQKQMKKFFNEAQTQACIKNIHVVNVTESFLLNHTAFYVMEYVDGQNLSQIVKDKNGPIDKDTSNSIFLQVIDALFAIHAKGILHLDIKPSNIMMDRSGIAKIVDFGTAKTFYEGTDTISTYTPAYAPMEVRQQRPEAIGPWTDIYSLGATYYYIITANRPPQENDIVDYGEGAFKFSYNIDSKTRKLIMWMMRPARKERPQSVLDILKYLENGLLPNDFSDSDRTEVQGHQSGDTTDYVSIDNYNRTNVDADVQVSDQDRYRPKKKSNGGCWVFLILFLLFAGTGYYLYTHGMLDKFFKKNDDTSAIEEERIQHINDSILQVNLQQQKEIEYYDSCYELLDKAIDNMSRVQSLEEIDILDDDFSRAWKELERKYEGVDLNRNHYNILVRLKEKLQTMVRETRDSLQIVPEIEIQPTDDEMFSQDEQSGEYSTSDSTESEATETYQEPDASEYVDDEY